MTPTKLPNKVAAWLAERIDLGPIRELIEHKTVPVHAATRWYYFGGITLFLFAIQVITGMLLLLYYRPTVGEAFDSVRFIITRVEFGWLIRSIHSWSANLLVFAAFVHMFSVVFTHAYRKPRGTHLVQRHRAAGPDAGLRVQRLPAALEQDLLFRHEGGYRCGGGGRPLIGPLIARFLRGGEDVGGPR